MKIRKIGMLILSCLLVAACSHPSVLNNLKSIDQKIWHSNYTCKQAYIEYLDTLNSMNVKSMNSGERAYYSLLHSITSFRAGVGIKDDSLITYSLKWYSSSKFYYEYARSLLFKGIFVRKIFPSDTSSFSYLKKAESIMEENKINDSRLFAMIYSYMGLILYGNNDNKEAQKYYNKSQSYYNKIGDIYNSTVLSLDIVWCKMTEGKNNEAKLILDSIYNVNKDVSLYPGIYNAYAAYYSIKKEYKKSIEYKKLQMKYEDSLTVIESRRNFVLSKYYSRSGQADSAIFYGKQAVLKAKAGDNNMRFYHKQLADIYYGAGMYKSAYKSATAAYDFLNANNDEISNKRILELEKKYNLAEKERQLSKEKERRILTITILISGMVFVFLVSAYSMIISRLKRKNAEKDKEKMKVAYDMLKENLVLIPEMLRNIDELMYRNVANEAIFEDIQKVSISNRVLYKEKISNMALNLREFWRANGMGKLTNLSDKEAIVYQLLNQDYSYSEIAKMLCVSDGNVRAIRHKIFKKIGDIV